ncbi:MAG TPA: hypothetical protein VNH65_02155 [Candidatus Acidoferrum sp.]|nr:hypothetical protein [Candidatus Acidoferrum sp.]
MSTQEKTNVQSVSINSAVDSTRCHHRTPSGRRCKLPVEAPGELLCYTHAIELKKSDVLNLKTALLTDYQGFQTAQGINSSLSNLYKLLANNYISPRRAAVLAHISSLLLRTLPAIDADQAAGIEDPTAPKETETELASSETNAEDVCTTTTPTKSFSNATQVWDASNEPDPTKKPS